MKTRTLIVKHFKICSLRFAFRRKIKADVRALSVHARLMINDHYPKSIFSQMNGGNDEAVRKYSQFADVCLRQSIELLQREKDPSLQRVGKAAARLESRYAQKCEILTRRIDRLAPATKPPAPPSMS